MPVPDHLTKERRSLHMSRIKRADTKPELIVRRLLHRLGYRFRLQWKAAPGRPDVAFPRRRKVIFVHGCFWHQHPGCKLAHIPNTRRDFWEAKFDRNRARDARDLQRCIDEGWSPLVIWECEVKDEAALGNRLSDFLGPAKT
ncbi:very short patch repair endonuclease [Sphingomonas beigongshangi]|uniref:very short patch repair endonuclease n=1 Tax=Sphingomonas beigongshangi TaxID=2782540 RepID=UPI003B846C31